MKKEFTTLMLILIGLTGVKAQDVQLKKKKSVIIMRTDVMDKRRELDEM